MDQSGQRLRRYPSQAAAMGACAAGAPMDNDSNWIGLLWGVLVMVLISLASIAPIVVVLIKLPATYFQPGPRPAFNWQGYHPGVRWMVWVLRKLLGLVLIGIGFFLVLPGIPGQGLLTILIGVLVLDLPGMRSLERKLVGRPAVFRAINRLRHRFGKPPLVLDGMRDDAHQGDGTPAS